MLEVQLAIDPDKLFTWPAYLSGARLRHRCNTILVVMTPAANVADWARRVIAFGPGAGHLQPHVIGPSEMPAITDPVEAARSPEMAVISAIAHGHDRDPARAGAIAAAAASAVFAHLGDRAQLYYDYVWANLGEAARKALEMLPQNYEYQHEGFRRAKAEGKAEGVAEGEAKGKAEQRSRIVGCSDPAQLGVWLQAAATAVDAASVLGG